MATTAAPAEAPAPAYRSPSYLRYVTGQAVSIVGDQVWYVALSWAAVQLASPGVAGVILSVSAVPRILLMLFGGVFVDRFGPRRIMMSTNVICGVTMLAASAIALWSPSIVLLVIVALVFGAADALFMPASGAMAPRLLEKEQYASGSALRELAGRAALTIGAPLGGALVVTGGLPLAAAVNAVTFAVSLAALWTVRPRPVESESAAPTKTLTALRDGFAYLRRTPVVAGLLAVALLVNLGFVGPMNVGLALVSEERGWGSKGIGWLLAGFGVGAALAALVLLKVKPRGRVGWVIAVAATAQGVSLIALGLVSSLVLGVACTLIAGMSGGLMGVTIGTVISTVTDDAYRGRVSSVSMFANLGLSPLAVAATGVLVAATSIETTFAISGALAVAGGVLVIVLKATRGTRV
ncbi:MFS transporter [Actinorhabdospora filicis]|uniref:MFS transporter n=1 Tax=Actinorhabdospora filicis TaxID=1785913 RepID=A0A9W6SHK7_9ACTN|nr:MFS transporter [Actinorhabdospora filicis]GLZ75616.1 MFS transporter [Actinorhabdospora filicis]